MNQNSIENLVHALYDGILDDVEWYKAFDALRRLTNSEHSELVVWNMGIDEVIISDVFNVDRMLADDYEKNFSAFDPAKESVSRLPVGAWYVDARDLGLETMRASDFYGDFLNRHGLGSVMFCPLLNDGVVMAGISYQAGINCAPFNGTESILLEPLVPHIQRALTLRTRYQKLSQQSQLGGFILDRFLMPTMVVDVDGKILLSNNVAEEWIERVSPVRSGKAEITSHICAIAKKICDTENHAPVAAVKFESKHATTVSYLVGVPLVTSHPLARHWSRPVGVIIVQQMAHTTPKWADLFRELFGLSPAETRLLECLSRYDSLYEAALDLGVSKETARSQLKSIFHKTGVNKQAALSRLIVQLSQLH